MKKILLCCSAGMSTSLMVNKMQKAAADKGIEVEIWAEPMDKASSEVPKADVVLLGPQIKFALPEIKKLTDQAGNKIGVIDMMDYGMMNGEKVLNMEKFEGLQKLTPIRGRKHRKISSSSFSFNKKMPVFGKGFPIGITFSISSILSTT